jgi:hypothetical protein
MAHLQHGESEGRIQPRSGHWLRGRPMDAKAKRKVIADMLAKLQRNMEMVVEMPGDWDETEPGPYLVHRAEMFSTHHFANRMRRKAFEHAVRNRGL